MATARLDESTDLGIEKQPRRTGLLVIVGLAAALVLAAGGGAAWYFLAGPGADAVAAAGGKGKKAKRGAEEAPPAEAPPIYHPLDPPFVANLPPGGKARMIQAAVRVQTRDPALVSFLQQNDPMVRHHLLGLLGAQDAGELMTRAGRERLQAEVRDTVARLVAERGAEGKVDAVYFTQFVLQ
jgi:flagellar FliL protein